LHGAAGAELQAQIARWMQDVEREPGTHAQAIIAPWVITIMD